IVKEQLQHPLPLPVFCVVARLRILRLPHLVSSIYFQTFHLVISADFAFCAVTTDAHYREFSSDRKG
ncbi:hypothetical protein, partial [Morganella morganii]|uniref:hypothetical protein n=2 Tax=Morganella morganii TaxID=582 RepID=UPI001C8BC9F5